uniref:Uncharacterized protein n=1 Tax=Lepeophtheirus salmonis TaxID=72036 RepID=A0A0K2UBL6_LEPSM
MEGLKVDVDNFCSNSRSPNFSSGMKKYIVIRSPLYGNATILHLRSSLCVTAYLISDANMVGTLTVFSGET